MTLTIIFKNIRENSHSGQAFSNVAKYEFHNTYNFLELQYLDGTIQFFNLADVFSVRVETKESLVKK